MGVGELSRTSFNLTATRSGEPRSLHIGVSGFDSRGREGIYGKELPN